MRSTENVSKLSRLKFQQWKHVVQSHTDQRTTQMRILKVMFKSFVAQFTLVNERLAHLVDSWYRIDLACSNKNSFNEIFLRIYRCLVHQCFHGFPQAVQWILARWMWRPHHTSTMSNYFYRPWSTNQLKLSMPLLNTGN